MKISSAEGVKKWRKGTKERMVRAMGSKCVCCGYSKCYRALALHHLNPNEKEMRLGSVSANPISWKRIAEELRKCVLVCTNCHSEIHDGMTKIPKDAERFNENYATYKIIWKDECPKCGKLKSMRSTNCIDCSDYSPNSKSIDWENIDLPGLIKKYKYWAVIGRHLGVSDTTVKSWAKRLGVAPTGACPICNNHVYNTKFCSTECRAFSQRRADRPSKAELKKMISKMSWCAIGRMYNVSDNSVRKWARKHELIK